jgi:hypothetical protein
VYLLPLYPPVALLAAGELDARLPSRLLARSAAVMVVMVMACAGGTLLEGWFAARHEPLLAFARLVDHRISPGAPLGATGRVDENDVLVLAYVLDRPLRRVRAGEQRPRFVIAPSGPKGALTADCEAMVGPIARLRRLVLLRCPEDDARFT